MPAEKLLTYFLRHGGRKEGLSFRNDGYVRIDELIKHYKFRGTTRQDIINIVNNDPKCRFKNIIENGINWVKAFQGHSMDFPNLTMTKITRSHLNLQPIHGTYSDKLNDIRENGLQPNKNGEVYFRTTHERNPKRSVDIYLNLEKCLADGLELYLTDNNVVLSKSTIKPKYFDQIVI